MNGLPNFSHNHGDLWQNGWNISNIRFRFLSFRVICHFHDYGRKGISALEILQREVELLLELRPKSKKVG